MTNNKNTISQQALSKSERRSNGEFSAETTARMPSRQTLEASEHCVFNNNSMK